MKFFGAEKMYLGRVVVHKELNHCRVYHCLEACKIQVVYDIIWFIYMLSHPADTSKSLVPFNLFGGDDLKTHPKDIPGISWIDDAIIQEMGTGIVCSRIVLNTFPEHGSSFLQSNFI